MIRRNKDMQVQVRENIRGGSGTLENTHLFSTEEMLNKCNLCTVFTFDPGDSIGPHPHDPDAEIYYILSGELCVTDEGVEHTLYPGDAMFTSKGEVHSVANKSDKQATMMAIILP